MSCLTWAVAVLLQRSRMASTLALYRQCGCTYVLFKFGSKGRKNEKKNFLLVLDLLHNTYGTGF